MQLHQFHAKNVGIRHSTGQYILITNSDVILAANFGKNQLENMCCSHLLGVWLRKMPLRQNILYTSDTRHHISNLAGANGIPRLELTKTTSIREMVRLFVSD